MPRRSSGRPKAGPPRSRTIAAQRGSRVECFANSTRLRVIADRMNGDAFYAIDGNGTFLASTDAGSCFTPKPAAVPRGQYFHLRDSRPCRPRLGASADGLFHTDDAVKLHVRQGHRHAHRIGFGKPATGADYPAIYLTGKSAGVYGFYRSLDTGKTWHRINDDLHQFGTINTIAGDPARVRSSLRRLRQPRYPLRRVSPPMKSTSPTLKLPFILHGGDYNPEQWPKSVWDEDVRHVRIRTSMSQRSPSSDGPALQPAEDQFTFEWLDEIIDKLHRAGMKLCLATPTASMPPWMRHKYPQTLRADKDAHRIRRPLGNRQNTCPRSRPISAG